MKKSFVILAAIMLSVVSVKAQSTIESNAYQIENFALQQGDMLAINVKVERPDVTTETTEEEYEVDTKTFEDVNDMLNVMDICPEEKSKLRGLYSLYFAAIADAETLDATFLKTSPRIYDYRDQAKAKRKYAQKIMKKIEKAISEL
ncbi:MAG: hypothetical protein Q4D33_03565 [Prevotellaceae bacterium]|nr:hypothetical protein [Prevotellaceae bacterium]